MTKLTQEKLCFAKAIGATHFYDGDFWKNGDNGDIYYWNQYKTGWKSTKEDLSAMGTSWDDYKIDFSQPVNKEEEAPRPDMVNKPPHYQADNGIECIDAIRAALGLEGFIAYCRGNAIKYGWRAGKKDETAQDLRKAAWYLDRAAQELGK